MYVVCTHTLCSLGVPAGAAAASAPSPNPPQADQQQQQQQPDNAADQQQQQQQEQQQQQAGSTPSIEDRFLAMQDQLNRLAAENRNKDEALQQADKEKNTLSNELKQFRYASKTLLKSDDTKVLTQQAKAHNEALIDEAHTQAQELLPAMDYWVRNASPDARRELNKLYDNIGNLAAANKELLDNDAALNVVVTQTRLFHNLKQITDKQVSDEQTKTAQAQQQLQQAQSFLKQEQEKHAKTLNDYARVQRRIDLLEKSVPNSAIHRPAQQQQQQHHHPPNQMGMSEAVQRFGLNSTLIQSTASAASTTTTTGSGGPTLHAGEKRNANQAQLNVKQTTASAGSAAGQGIRNVRPRIMQTDERYGGSWMGQDMTPPALGGVFDILTQGFATEMNGQGLSSAVRQKTITGDTLVIE